MAESIAEGIVEAIRTRIEGIAEDNGVNYWFEWRAIRTPTLTEQCLDASLSAGAAALCALIPDEEEKVEEASLTLHGDMRLDLALATRFAPASENPLNPPDPDRWKLQNRMARDVQRRLLDDSTTPLSWFGVLGVENLEVLIIDRTPEHTFLQGWALVFLRIVVRYSHLVSAP